MTRIWWGTALALVPLLGLAGSGRADRAAEIFSYARSTGFFAGGCYAVPASAQSFVKVLTTSSPPPQKR